MDTELTGLEKADNSGRLWVVPNRVTAIEPCPQDPEGLSRLTLAGGHSFMVVGSVEQIAKKLRGQTGSLLGMHAPIGLATLAPARAEPGIGRDGQPDERRREERSAPSTYVLGLVAGQTRR